MKSHSVQQLSWLEPTVTKGLDAKGNDNDSLTRVLQQTTHVAEIAKRYTPSQTDVIYVVMDALVRIYVGDLMATRNVLAIT